MAITKCPFNSIELEEVGNDLASGWGAICYAFRIDNTKKEVVFYCKEYNEKFITSESFESLNVRKLTGRSPMDIMYDDPKYKEKLREMTDSRKLTEFVEKFCIDYNKTHKAKIKK